MTLTRVNTNGITDGTVQPADLAIGGPLSGFRNLVINGNPTINQRGYVSGTNTTGANQYTLDRWRVVTNGQNITFSTTAGICTVTAPAGGVEQVVEGASILGGTYVLNWTGTATATINGNAVAKGGTVTLTGGSDATIRLSGGTFTQVQLEPGSVATAFENRPLGMELMLCQRYYEKGKIWARSYFYNSSTNAADTLDVSYSFKQTKRIGPTLAFTNLGTGTITSQIADVEMAAFRRTGAFDGNLDITFTASAEF